MREQRERRGATTGLDRGRMRKQRVSRWFRSLQAQAFLWAILPLTFAIIALAFTGVYAHQRQMRDFVAERDLELAQLTARVIEDGLGHGTVSSAGDGLSLWLEQVVGDQSASLQVLDGRGQPLAWLGDGLALTGESLDSAVAAAVELREGARIVTGAGGDAVLIAVAPVASTDWLVLISEPVAGIIGPILRLSSLAPIVAAGAGVVSLLVLTFGWRTIVRPLQALARATEQVTWGDYSAISRASARPLAGVQEVQDLHSAVADMVERIRAYEASIRDYLGAVAHGQEAERSRLAQELHDGPVQELIALAQRAERAQRLVEQGQTVDAGRLMAESRLAELAAVDELRRIIGALRPVYLDDLGFLPALEMLVRQMGERTTARVTLEIEGTPRRFHPDVELAAYRIAQEALNNALRHAEARTITIHVGHEADGLALSIRDDGQGFAPPARPDVLTRAGHFGLVGMQERATRLGGQLTIDSAPGAGTRVTMWLPVNEKTLTKLSSSLNQV